MAYVTLLSLTETLEFILNPHDDQSPVFHQTGQQALLRSLHRKLSFLQSFLEEDIAQTKSQTMTRLETRIREMGFTAVHTIECIADGLQLEYNDLLDIMEQVSSVVAEVVKIKKLNVIKNHPSTKFSPVGSSKSVHVDKSPIVGFRDELMAIKERLFTPPSELAIISIVGMGGIGKTTLARTIFDDSKIVSRFDARGWLTVSQDYDVQDMLGHLLKSIRGNESNQDESGERLYKSLKQKRYLVVIDDLWDIKAWDRVKRFFPRDNTGSRIILTTRLLDVADEANSASPIYRLSLLSLDDSWKLLRQKVFGEESCPRELEEIGKEIAKNCKGLPLALAIIGGLLSRRDKKIEYWMDIQQNINLALARADNDFAEILALSYYHLPHQLRACFLYMGFFPEDYEVRKSELIRLWVAYGFVKPHKSKSLEEVAHEYLQDLIDRNMILVRQFDSIGGIKRCGIHDLMRDACARIIKEDVFLGQGDEYSASIPLLFMRGLDPLLSFMSSSQRQRVWYAQGNLGELRGNVANLRFLSLTTSLQELAPLAMPFSEFDLNASISKLLQLHTLIIDSSEPITLPEEIWNMPRLRHILTEGCFFSYPSGAQNGHNFALSKNLQTLKGLKILSSTEDVLRLMTNLKKLKIIFRDVTGIKLSSYVSEYFVHLNQLEDLYCLLDDTHDNKNGKPLVEDFSLPSSLRKFTLDGCSLSSKTMTIIGSLPDLQVLKVRECDFVKKFWEPIEGEFDKLKSLLLYWSDLRDFKADETSFPNLECLKIFGCYKLKNIPSTIGDIPTLRLIELDQSSEYGERSAVLIRKKQEDMGNENLKIIIRDLDEDEDGEEDDDDDKEEDEDDDDDEDEDDDEEDVEDRNKYGEDGEEDAEDSDNDNDDMSEVIRSMERRMRRNDRTMAWIMKRAMKF